MVELREVVVVGEKEEKEGGFTLNLYFFALSATSATQLENTLEH